MRKFLVQVSQTTLYEVEMLAVSEEQAVELVLGDFSPDGAKLLQVDDLSATVTGDLGPVWSTRDEESVFAEGWVLLRSTEGQRQIRALPGEHRRFMTDQAAETYVKRQAAGGSERHRRACDLVVHDLKKV